MSFAGSIVAKIAAVSVGSALGAVGAYNFVTTGCVTGACPSEGAALTNVSANAGETGGSCCSTAATTLASAEVSVENSSEIEACTAACEAVETAEAYCTAETAEATLASAEAAIEIEACTATCGSGGVCADEYCNGTCDTCVDAEADELVKKD